MPDEPEEDDPVVLMYTGGTTGLPKGVLLDQRAEMLNLLPHDGASVSIDASQIYLHQTPMFHAASMGGILGIPALGAASVFIPLFDPGKVMDLIEGHGVTWTVMVPTMIGMLLAHPSSRPERLASLKHAHLRRLADAGGDPREAARPATPTSQISQGYGMTEAPPCSPSSTAEDHRARRRAPALGRAAGAGCRALHPGRRRHRRCPRVRPVRSAPGRGNFMREYWNKPEATEEVFRGGWYHTGDAGYLDDDGYLFLVDRVKDMIVTGGENVYSVEVENAISTHPAVAQVAVIGIPHETWGEAVHAIVVLGRRARRSPRRRSRSFTPRARSPATRCPSRSSSAPSRCPCRAP